MVTLVYSSHDEEHNNAVALQEYLRAKLRRPVPPPRSAAALYRSIVRPMRKASRTN
jgi:hypothetical protein